MEKTILVTHCNPLNPAQTWSGKGRRPAWLNALGWRNDRNAREIAVSLYGNRWLTPAEFQAIRESVTVTEKQEELPGLPPPPKKRGRPATGKALTPAERKRNQRYRDLEKLWNDITALSTTALLEQIQSAIADRRTATAHKLIDELNSRVDQLEQSS